MLKVPDQAKLDEAKKVNWTQLNPGIEFAGKKIVLPGEPAPMPLKEAAAMLIQKAKDEETGVQVHEIIEGYPLDAAVAFTKAIARLYGWASPVPIPTFFGPIPPSMISIRVGIGTDDVVQCPMGGFQLPGVEIPAGNDPLQTHIGPFGKNKQVVFLVQGVIKKKSQDTILEITKLAREILKNESIYRGKAIRLNVDAKGNPDTSNPPEFIDTRGIGEEDLIFDTDIKSMVDTNMLVPIRFTDEVKRQNIPLKRGILLEGPFGTGKSLLARLVAHECEANGWTFVLLDRVQGLRQALEFAKMFEPAVVFAEDIDRVMSERDEAANDLINTIDGVISKRSEIMIVLTTNFADKLDKVILRPGRLDAVISLRPPTDEAVQKLLRHYGGSLINKDSDLSGAGKALSGQIPASIRECVERAKLGMVGRGARYLIDEDLVTAAKTMQNHMDLLNGPKPAPNVAQQLADNLREVITKPTVENTIAETHEGVNKLKARLSVN